MVKTNAVFILLQKISTVMWTVFMYLKPIERSVLWMHQEMKLYSVTAFEAIKYNKLLK